MKWTLTNFTNEKFAKIPSSNVPRRNSSRFLAALLRYSMRKRKLSSNESSNIASARLSTFTNRRNCFGRIDCHQTKRFLCPLSKEELSAIQMQLALLSDSDGDRPIHIAIMKEDLKLVQKLCHLMLKNKISLDIPNYLRQTPLHLAVMLGNIEIIQQLLNCGASPTACDRNGNTILHLCVKSHSDGAVLQHLLSYNQVKDILNSMDYEGYSALHYAVFKNNLNAVKIIRASGVDMNKIDGKSGRTALIHAVLEQNVDMVELLLKSDACPQKTDYSGRSAFDMAVQIGNKRIIQLLENCIPNNEITSIKEKHPVHHSLRAKRTKC